jgi:hypothetical protein
MNKPELYQKTVDILVDAYFNDTLAHGNPCGCAVGNIVAANMGFKYKRIKSEIEYEDNVWPEWFGAVCKAFQISEDDQDLQIASTGYAADEIIEIEYAFENAYSGNSDDEWMFNGLIAVIEVLDQIHGNTDAEITTTSKARLNKQPA